MRCGKGEARFSTEGNLMRYEFRYRRFFGLLPPKVVTGKAKPEHVILTDKPNGERLCYADGNIIWNKAKNAEA